MNNWSDWLSRVSVISYDVGFGCRQYTAFHPDYPGPVGVVWASLRSDGECQSANVIHSYTLPFYRRRGIRSLINKTIMEECEVITTPGGSDDGGLDFLKAAGYQYDPQRKDWFLTRNVSESSDVPVK